MSFLYGRPTAVTLGAVTTLTGNSGGAVSPTSGNINIVGSGDISVTGNPGTSTLTIEYAGSSGFTWNQAGSDTNMTSNNGYIPNDPWVFTLPSSDTTGAPSIGDVVRIVSRNAGYSIVQYNNLSSPPGNMYFGNMSSQSSSSSIVSTAVGDSIELVCVGTNIGPLGVINGDWVVASSVGNFTLNDFA